MALGEVLEAAVEHTIEKKKKEDAKYYDGFDKKNPSHRGFYPQFIRGVSTALDGLRFAVTDPDARAVIKPMLPDIAKGSGAVLVVAFLWWAAELQSDPNANFVQCLFKSSKYGTMLATTLMTKKLTVDDRMFLLTLEKKEPGFAKVVSDTPKKKKTTKDLIHKFQRMGKMFVLRFVKKAIIKVSPQAALIAAPVVRFAGMRMTLGSPLAATVAALEAIPGSQAFEEPLSVFCESAIDSLDLAADLIKPYTKRLASKEQKDYLEKRYQGYLTGAGVLFELFMSIPILSVLVYVLAEAAAALEVLYIVKHNKDKTKGHKSLLGEDAVAAESQSMPSSVKPVPANNEDVPPSSSKID